MNSLCHMSIFLNALILIIYLYIIKIPYVICPTIKTASCELYVEYLTSNKNQKLAYAFGKKKKF